MNQYFLGLTGNVVTPESSVYQEARQGWNRSVQQFPLVIVYCYDKTDVSNAVIWARQHSIDIRIRSGGHHYCGYSNGNGVLVIDVSNMNRIKLEDDRLYVDGGVRNKELYDFISPLGYPFPGGACPTVGVSGYISGGGWGLSSRWLGLGCDSLLELELVNAEGQILKASAYENPDLFWACRGAGGGNFGVIVSMVFQLPQKVDDVTHFEFYYPDTYADKQAKFIQVWQNWLPWLDWRLTLQASLSRNPDDGFSISGQGLFYGTEAEAERLLKPVLSLGSSYLKLEKQTFYEAITKIGSNYPESELFRSTGRFVVKPLDDQEIHGVADLLREIPVGSVYSALNLSALGGMIAEKRAGDTAYYYRDASYILSIQTVWEEEQYAPENKWWLNRKYRYLESVTQGSFINFPFSGLKNYMNAYYGGNSYHLRLVKKRYDPHNLFHFPQSIR